MSDTLTLKYTPAKDDYTQVLRIYFLRQTGIQISLGFLVVAFIYTLYMVARQSTAITPFEIIWLLMPPVFLYYILFMQPKSMGKRAMATEQLAAEQTWELDDQGVTISNSAVVYVENEAGEKVQKEIKPSVLTWDNLKKLIIAKDYYLLVFKTEKNFFRFMPRRAFTSQQEQEQFLALVNSHISR